MACEQIQVCCISVFFTAAMLRATILTKFKFPFFLSFNASRTLASEKFQAPLTLEAAFLYAI